MEQMPSFRRLGDASDVLARRVGCIREHALYGRPVLVRERLSLELELQLNQVVDGVDVVSDDALEDVASRSVGDVVDQAAADVEVFVSKELEVRCMSLYQVTSHQSPSPV